MLDCCVLLDLETTGGNPVRDRITEVAAVRMEHGQEVARLCSLVNPGMPVPPFIERLTGISNAMVAQAPRFEDLAADLLHLLDGAVLVAHNVRFDHGFLQQSFARMDTALKVKTLCTVRLSRSLYPQHKHHGLDALIQRHGLHVTDRHRALGDVQVMQPWLPQVQQDLGLDAVRAGAQRQLQGSAALPPHLETPVDAIPDGPGVYLMYGEGALPLYVGKSVHLRSRVMSHFQAAGRNARELRLAQEVRRIEWHETAGELGALLLESRWVKTLQPALNRQLRRERGLCAWRLDANPAARPLLTLVRGDELDPRQLDCLYGPFRTKTQAVAGLRQLADQHRLCPQALGLEPGKGRCFAHQLGRCAGVCCGDEPAERHFLRLQTALTHLRLQTWPFDGPVGVREHHAGLDRTEIHIFDHWCHLATVRNESDWQDALTTARWEPLAFDLDTYRLALKALTAPAAASRLLRLPRSTPENR